MPELTYNPRIFEVEDDRAARGIILTSQAGLSTDERWERETPYLADLVRRTLGLCGGELVLDYGCGVGRMARALIDGAGVSVLGVDISTRMRARAPAYVGRAGFSAVSRRLLQVATDHGARVDAAFSVWVLQHCFDPEEDLGLIRAALRPGGRFMVVNNLRRAVPSVESGWADDGKDLRRILEGMFSPIDHGSLDGQVVGAQVADNAFWAVYERR